MATKVQRQDSICTCTCMPGAAISTAALYSHSSKTEQAFEITMTPA